MLKLLSTIAAGVAAVLAVYVVQSAYCQFIEKAINKPATCLICQGKGEVTCLTCFGRGESFNFGNLNSGIAFNNPPRESGPQPCKACQGKGKHACKACGD